jgi:Cu(I)/Ag(I) efflux system membrane fusion protein
MKLKDPRTVAVAATSALVLVIGFFIVQHLRHGWPFSLHHGIGVAPVPARLATREDGGVPPAHPRAEVELGQAELDSIGVRLEKARREAISQPIRAVATVVPDESRVSHVHTRVPGWIEKLYVSTTGERVRAGQPLAGIFSQELLSTQNEYLAARRAAAASPRSAVGEGARARLKVLGMTDGEIRAIEEGGEARRLVTVTAPRAGIVLHRGISVGTAVDPSTEIVTVADLSRVWVLAELSEGDIPSVEIGTPATLEFRASGREPFEGKVEFLYPTLSERTRTLRVRFAADNPGGTLRPGIYGTATFRVSPRSALTVPRDAVVDTGTAQHVFVVAGERRFAPRLVKLGTRFGDRIEVREGVEEGESVVASGVFLIDSESRLRASGGTGHVHGSGDQQGSGTGHEGHAPAAATPTAVGAKHTAPRPSATARPGATLRSHEAHEPAPPAGHEGHEGHQPAPPTGHEGHQPAPPTGHEGHEGH